MATFMLLLFPMLTEGRPEWHGSFPTLEACVKAADRQNFNAQLWLSDPVRYEAGWRFICAELRPSV